MAKLQDELGITSFAAIPVTHCRDAYAVVIQGTSLSSSAHHKLCEVKKRERERKQKRVRLWREREREKKKKVIEDKEKKENETLL